MEKIEWSNRISSHERKPFLLFIRGDEIISFAGSSIPGVVEVYDTNCIKNRELSHTIYHLKLANDIRHIAGLNGWKTGGFIEGLGYALNCTTPYTWADTAKALGISIPSAMKFLRIWQPETAKKLDGVEQALMELHEVSTQETYFIIVAIVTVSFGAPSYQAIREGYWRSPKSIPGFEAQIRLIDQNGGWIKENIEVIGISGKVLAVEYDFGMNGGYYAVSIAVVSWKGGIPVFPIRP